MILTYFNMYRKNFMLMQRGYTFIDYNSRISSIGWNPKVHALSTISQFESLNILLRS